MFKRHDKVFDKIVNQVSVSFVIFASTFKVMFNLYNVSAKIARKNHYRSFKWVWHPPNRLASFRVYIIPTKLLFKLCFGYFQFFLRLCSLFLTSAPIKSTKNYHPSLKKVLYQGNFFCRLQYMIGFLKKLLVNFSCYIFQYF